MHLFEMIRGLIPTYQLLAQVIDLFLILQLTKQQNYDL